MNALLSLAPQIYPPVSAWAFVTRRFQRLQEKLDVSPAQMNDLETSLRRVVKSLNRAFRGESSFDNYFVAGSWRKRTNICPSSDLDIMFVPPRCVYDQFSSRKSAGQSQILQSIRSSLLVKNPTTRIKGDGQAVVVDLSNWINIEIVPAFRAEGGGFLICDSSSGGRWLHVDPESESRQFDYYDNIYNGNARKLSRIIKQWAVHCKVPIKPFCVEQLVRETLDKPYYASGNEWWFDWIIRDIFWHMLTRAGGRFQIPSLTGEIKVLGDEWRSKAWTAYQTAQKVSEYEFYGMNDAAGAEWQKLFGPKIPRLVV